MVAVVSGSNLGLVNAGTANGDAAVGLGRDRAYVNSTSGNLVVQSTDDVLSSVGLDSVVVRTYNSQGTVDGDNDDNWRIGVYRNLFGIPGTPGATNSTISKRFGDGTEVLYRWDATAGPAGLYVGTDGDGAHDTLSYSGGTWTWTDGSGRNTETYDASGKLVNSKDADGNVVTYVYNGTLLIRVDDASGQQTHLIYNASRQLTDVQVVSNGVTQTLTKYAYDSLDRLERVTVDLTPSVTTDSVTYVTRYTYDGNSQRLASIINSDGTAASFTYQLIDGAYRVRSFSPTEAGLITAPADTNALVTQVPQTTSADRNLTSAATPAGWGAFPTDLSTTTVAESNPIIKYDAAGNAFAAWYGYPTGVEEYHVFLRRYDAASGTWSAATVMDVGDGDWDPYAAYALALDVDASGNAVLAWTLGDVAGVAASARTYSASSGTWSSAQVLRAGDGIHKNYWSMKATINGSRAIVSWDVHGNYSDPVLLQTARFDGSSWQTTDTLDNNLGNQWKFISGQTIAMDAQGNALMMWSRALAPNPADGYQQYNNTYYRYFNAASGTWGAETLFFAGSYGTSTTASFGVGQTEFVFDNSGSIFATYRIKTSPTGTSDLMSRKFSVASQTWGLATLIESRSSSNGKPFSFAVTASGDAVMAYAWDTDVFVRTYSAASQSWSAETALPLSGGSTSAGPGVPRVLVNNGQIAVTWVGQPSGTNARQFVYMSRYTSSGWTVASNAGDAVVDGSTNGAYTSAMDRFGNVTALWGISYYQTSYPNGALLLRTFSPTPTYTIPSGATWSSVTQALYGDGSTAAVTALQAVIGTPPLTAGTLLRGLPATLHVVTTVMVPVTPYYNVTSTTTWLNIVQSVYGTTDPNAIDALRNNYFPGLTLADGQHLQVPLTLQFTASGSNTTLVTYNTGAVQNTANANPSSLSTTDTQTSTNNYNVVSGSLSTTDTQTTTNSYSLNGGQLSTTDNQTTSYNRNNGVLSTTDTQNVTNNYSLNTGQLSTTDTQSVTTNYAINTSQLSTTQTQVNNYGLSTSQLAPAGWTSSAFGTPTSSGSGIPQTEWVKFDGAGNGLAVSHYVSGSTFNVYARRFSSATQTWSGVETVYSGPAGGNGALKMDMDAQGNAIVVWTGMQSGNVPLLLARRFTFAGGWGATSTVYSGAAGFPDTSYGSNVSMAVSISGNYAAIAWIDGAAMAAAPWGQPATIPAYVSRFNGSSWSSPVQTGNTTALTSNARLSVGVDSSGNTMVVSFSQINAQFVNYVHAQRFNASTGTWGSAVLLDSGTLNAVNDPELAIDGNGNAFVTWTLSGDSASSQYVRAARFDRNSNSWGTTTSLLTLPPGTTSSTIYETAVAADSSGNAMAVYRVSQSGVPYIYARYYNGASGTWAAQQQVTTSGAWQTQRFSVAANNGRFALVYGESPGGWGASTTLRVSRFDAGSWQDVGVAGTVVDPFIVFGEIYRSVAIQPNGNVAVIWSDSTNTYIGSYRATASYTVPSGATWASIAGTLYGVSSSEAGAALQSAMGNPSIAAGNVLFGWPSTLAVTTTVNIGPHYVIQSGDTWQIIANRLYGVNNAEAANALQSAMGSPALVAGNRLMNPPTTLSVTVVSTVTVPPYYTIPGGSTWQSVAGTLYGINSTPAGSALQSVYGGQALSAFTRLTGLPSTLSVTTQQTVTVPAYYLVPSGASWQSIANAVYGVNSAAAGSALQSVMGNPSIAAGTHLTGLPATLSVTVQVTVPAYYTIPSGATWQSIANTLYGINHANAGTALQSAMGNPALTAGNRLTGLPSSLSVTITQTITVPPYYTIPSGASWQSVANAVYGVSSNAAASALQTAMGGIALPAAGNRLTGFPNPLAVTTTTTITVPAYYLVPSGATWASITQAVYGVSDPNAVARLQTVMGNPTLTTGLHLNVPSSITYNVTPVGTSLSQSTDVQDAAGRITTFTQDSAGRLTSVLSPTTGGIRLETRYGYDSAGNLTTITEDPTGLNRVTTNDYDSRGNLTNSRDSLGNTISRTYDAFNQVLTETKWVVPDPDGAGAGSPGTPLQTRFVYDGNQTTSESHLRYVIDADGRVTQYIYNTAGLRTATLKYLSAIYTATNFAESDLNTWANVTANKTLLERTDYTYDFRGNIDTMTAYVTNNASTGAGTGTPSVTKFLYDQRGQLLQAIEARGSSATPNAQTPNLAYATTYAYDGLGRVTSTSKWDSASRLVTTLHTYDDANRRTTIAFANGLVTTSAYDKLGKLISVSNGIGGTTPNPTAFGLTTYSYDVNGRLRIQTDAALAKQFFFYDEAGRKVAQVDGDGSLIEYVYDRGNSLIKTIQYSTRLSSANLAALVNASGDAVDVPLSTLRSQAGGDVATNRVSRNVFDAAGRLVYTIDESGAVSQILYDGAGRVTDTILYATRISVPRSVGQLLPSDLTTAGSAYLVTTSVDDRRSRTFYDNEGHIAGTLDAGGYIVERTYDNAGHLKQETGFANRVTDAALLATGTLAQLKTAAGTDTETSTDFERDITTNYFYDGQGRNVGVLDGERFLTETVYDVAGNVSQVIRYNKVLTYSASSTLTSLRNAALASPAAVTHTTSYQYDGFGRVTQSIDFQGTQSNTTYDSVGNLISTTAATGTTEARTRQARYDEMGRVVRELSGEGSQALATLLANNPLATTTQINDVWDRYGILNTYDQAGRKVSSTVRPNDTQTNVTRYYYDQEGRLRFEVNQLGERTEYGYNALNQLSVRISYFNRISVAGLAGGELSQTVLDALTASADATRDARTTYTYDVTGRVYTTTSVEGALTTATYNAFGENDVSIEQIDATRSLRHDYAYNTRGLLTTTRWDSVAGGLNTSEVRDYDAFGRLTRITDERGYQSRIEYDRLGRQTATVNAASGRRVMTYDGFSRVLTLRDALTNTTTYNYDDATRTMTVTTPENIVLTTVSTRHGQTLSVTSAGNTTTYAYDLDGNSKGASDNLGTLESRTYDRGGRVENLIDARGVTTRFSYDAANRLLTKTDDYGTGNLQLVTSYGYDALGRVETVTEPSGRLTRNTYDRDGNITEVQVDPYGLNLRTSYTYDRQGRALTMTEGLGSAQPLRTQYIYDNLGRRTEEIVDPTSLGGTLNLRTQYRFDANGNVTRKIDAAGNSAWYVYDSLNRLTHTINALGNVTLNTYDAENHVTATRRYANALSAATLTTLGGLDSPTTANFSVSTNALDSLRRTFYDRNGREQYTIDAAGTVTERLFDAAGRATRIRILSAPALTATYTNAAAVTTALGASATTIAAEDRLQWMAYDARGRMIFSVDGMGGVVRNTYDENDNVVATTQFASRRPITDATDLASLQSWATANNSNTQNRVTRYWYDRLDRERFVLDAEGYLTETRYGDAARELRTIVYTRKLTLSANADLAEVTAAAAGIFMSDDQVTLTVRDIASRIWRVYDAAGSYEEYSYTAVGRKQTYRNQKGAIWTYVYDTAGRLSDERSPNVSITTVSSSGTVLSSASETASIVTRMTYDALGNVRTRTEGIRRYSDGSESTTGSRVTTYNYDVTGRQTSTVNPQVSVYNGNYTENTGTTSTTNVTPTSTTTYDALGNATRNVDVGGGTSYRVYDSLGRVRYEIDALRFVTEHVYDVFGNETALTRFSTALGSIPSFSGNRIALTTMDTAVSALRSNTDNRTIAKTYDRTNHVRSTREPSVYAFEAGATAGSGQAFTASPTTYFDYDAFGQVVREWKLVNPNGVAVTDPSVNSSANSWATVHHYFDRRGFEIGTVDELRYLTRREFDETGDVTNVREYALALTSFDINSTTAPTGVSSAPGLGIAPDAGYDRETTFRYDVMNRAVNETLLNFEHAWINGLITEIRVASKIRSYGYDALGNQTSVSEGGATVYNYYDVLGRMTARAEPSRNPGDGSTLIPLTEIKRDIFGNAAEEIRYGAGAASVNATSYTLASTSAALERHSLIKYDALDRATASQDARGAFRNAAYNARGDLVKEWQTVTNRSTSDMGATPTTSVAETLVTLYQYDLLGQRTVTHEVQRTTSTAITVRTRATYNGFGEIKTKTVDGGWAGEFYEYDNAGRIWRTNAGDGVDKVYLYNLAGKVTAEIRSRTLNLADAATYVDAASVNALTGTMRTENRYDLMNRVVEQRLPQFEIQATQDLIDSQPQVAVQATPNPPNALYRQIAVSGGSGYPGPWGGVVYVPQIVSYAEGGGWAQVQAPSAANPYGVYTRYSSEQYSVSQQRQFSWQKPAYDVIATFEYWPASNPAAVSTLDIYTLAPDRVGVNVNALSGNYGYRITYKRVGATSAFATQQGTFNTATNEVVRGTTAALQSQIVTPTVQQAFDRWGNVISIRDAAGGLTQYRYNQLNQLTYTLLPSAVILDTSVSIEQRVGRAQLSNYYDVNGRMFETRDATGNTTRVIYNNAGQTIRIQNADDAAQVGGSKKFFVYDAFNNVIQVKDELGYRTRNVYDKADNLVQVAREIELVDGFASAAANDTTAVNAANVVWEYYAYDETGRRVSDTNGEGEVTKYWYDLRGNMIRRRTPRNFDTTFEYDAFARKSRETDANATYSTWTYDTFGRLTAHAEMVNTSSIASYFTAGGATHAYTYDEAGLLTLETTSLGKNRAMAYDAAGHLTSITDNGTAIGGGLVSVNRVTTYNYDAAGRKSREREVIDGRTHQDTRIEYDGMGRIASLDDLDYRLQYFYDANGNRSLIKARYFDHTMVSKTEELYYRYDQMNRVTISQGQRSTGAVPDVIFNANQGVLITYDAKGQRTSARTKGTRIEKREYRTNGVYVNTTYVEFSPTDQLGTDYYKYDGLGRLTTLSRETDFVIRETTTGDAIGGNNIPTPMSVKTYDKAGRQIREVNYVNEGPNLNPRTTVTDYDDDGRTTQETHYNVGAIESIVKFGDAGNTTATRYNGYDAASVLRGYKVDVYVSGAYKYTTSYQNAYRLGEGYQDTGQSVSSAGTNPPGPASNSRVYDVNGDLVQFSDSGDVTRTRYFANNASGQALTTIQGQFDGASGRMTVSQAWDAAVNRSTTNQPKAQYFFFADGKHTGSFGQLQNTDGTFDANFDVNYTPVSSSYPSSAPSQVIAQTGDTLRTIAARIFGDGSLWYVLAQENGLTDPSLPIKEGTVIKVPNEVVSLSNTSNVFKPFDAGDALGDTNPTQPAPPAPKPKKGGCGVIGMIIVAIVAIVVTVFTAGAAAAALAPALGSFGSAVVGGAIGAAVGSIASQGVGIAIGVQDKFSWGAVAKAAIGGAIGGALFGVSSFDGSAIKGVANTGLLNNGGTFAKGLSTFAKSFGRASGFVQGAANAVVTNVVTQGVTMALGMQKSFSWRDVAASAAGGGVGAVVGTAASSRFGSSTLGTIATKTVSGFASGVAQSVVRGGKIDYASIAADAFGNAIGNSLVASMVPKADKTTSSSEQDEEVLEVVVTAEPPAGGAQAETDDLEEVKVTAKPRLASGDTEELEEVVVQATKKKPYFTQDELDEARRNNPTKIHDELEALKREYVEDVTKKNIQINELVTKQAEYAKKHPGEENRFDEKILKAQAKLTEIIGEFESQSATLDQSFTDAKNLHDRILGWTKGEPVQVNGQAYVIKGSAYKFNNTREAAIDAIASAFLVQKVIGDQFERGGGIYKRNDGSYGYTFEIGYYADSTTVDQGGNSITPGTPITHLSVRTNTQALWHIHPPKSFNNTGSSVGFSSQDPNVNFTNEDIPGMVSLDQKKIYLEAYLGGSDGSLDYRAKFDPNNPKVDLYPSANHGTSNYFGTRKK